MTGPRENFRACLLFFLNEESGKIKGWISFTKSQTSMIPAGGFKIPFLRSFENNSSFMHNELKGSWHPWWMHSYLIGEYMRF